ncbi:hypothetical protein EPIR_2702 [Erwinia piriflorinigrans CFBP 5888]|uniref:Uncharacterized protein n=1 Tax=Erwinia piriflorinigrans CFBP 5888 TaxID=1161919 RepID=V5ZA13_9GAMM|nr:hypothetical protein EPIR_2702 [Erwinia piriflorinigrans CFBP 5888]
MRARKEALRPKCKKAGSVNRPFDVTPENPRNKIGGA